MARIRIHYSTAGSISFFGLVVIYCTLLKKCQNNSEFKQDTLIVCIQLSAMGSYIFFWVLFFNCIFVNLQRKPQDYTGWLV